MTLGLHKRAAGVFSNHRDAEHALTELKHSGFDMGKVSVIAKDAYRVGIMGGAEVRDKDGNKADEGAKAGAITGGTLGGLTGLLVGLGALAIPGIGPVMLAGATATALATTLSGAAIGAAAGGLLGALVGLGIPEERAKVYNDRVNRGDYLVMVDGTEDDIHRAEATLSHRGIQEWGIYDAPAAATTTGATTTDANYATRTVDAQQNVGTGPDVVIIDRRDQTL
ncbi:MAG: signal transduction histidine kinase LytS [Aphanothece sp. CMT-3BRIN-NPC111]|nr:signal transduction histidine kinase LytS [Aphanothece sp. CMT-3BRIN-NPC111]